MYITEVCIILSPGGVVYKVPTYYTPRGPSYSLRQFDLPPATLPPPRRANASNHPAEPAFAGATPQAAHLLAAWGWVPFGRAASGTAL